MKITEKIFDGQTGETTIIEREETPNEKKAREDHEAKILIEDAEAKANADAKMALFSKLGITQEEANLLLS